ncbi:MAG: hypothetical protein PHF63_09215 [Herbinix sp.]|nr:hypothetical protein [Herbinix sp.]
MITVKIAGLNIVIKNKYKYSEVLCKDYISKTDDIDFIVSATEEEIMEEKKLSPWDTSIGCYESTCLFRKICLHVLDYDAFFMHSSVVAVDGQAYAFAAKAGTGKSTHTALWMKYFGERSIMVNGDKPIFRYRDGTLYACGHPWSGKEGLNTNTMLPLKGICFIERSEANHIQRLSQQETIDRLFLQMLMPKEKDRMDKFLFLLDRLVIDIPCYLLECNMTKEAVLTAYNAMNQEVL